MKEDKNYGPICAKKIVDEDRAERKEEESQPATDVVSAYTEDVE